MEAGMKAGVVALACAVLVATAVAAASGADQDCRECRELKSDLDRLKDQVSDLKREVDTLQRQAHSGSARSVRLVTTHSLTYTSGTQRCDSDEVVVGYEHREGEDRIRGDCAEIRLE
jgi:uncharacterized protein YlxW (UPF0749 family)